jgi:phospholipid transport system substrate-binding protein
MIGLGIAVSATRSVPPSSRGVKNGCSERRTYEKLRETGVTTLSRVVMSPRMVCAGALALGLVLADDAWAGPPTDTLRDAFAAVNRLLEDPALQEEPVALRAAIRRVVNHSLDFREAARLALGREWEVRTPAERDEFVRLLDDLLRHAYFSGLASRARMRGGLTVRYRDEAIEGGRATVGTTIVARDGSELTVEYRMIRDRDRWAVYDALIGGVSLVANYRAQFSRVIRQSSYPELVLRVKAKASEPLKARIVAKPVVGETGAAVVDRPRRTPEPAETPPPARPAPATAPSYWLQMGTFRDADTASRLVTRLLERNLPVAIDSVAVPTGRQGRLVARVRVGPFADEAEAVLKLQRLRTIGYRPLLARGSD